MVEDSLPGDETIVPGFDHLEQSLLRKEPRRLPLNLPTKHVELLFCQSPDLSRLRKKAIFAKFPTVEVIEGVAEFQISIASRALNRHAPHSSLRSRFLKAKDFSILCVISGHTRLISFCRSGTEE